MKFIDFEPSPLKYRVIFIPVMRFRARAPQRFSPSTTHTKSRSVYPCDDSHCSQVLRKCLLYVVSKIIVFEQKLSYLEILIKRII